MPLRRRCAISSSPRNVPNPFVRWVLSLGAVGTSIYGPLAAPIAVLLWLWTLWRVVRNPVQPKENFADRWRSRPGSVDSSASIGRPDGTPGKLFTSRRVIAR